MQTPCLWWVSPWSFRQGKTTGMLQTLASFENKEVVKSRWLQSEKMWGEKWGWWGLWVILCVLWGLFKAFWKMFHHAPWKHQRLLIATFSWAENNPPAPTLSSFTLFCFQPLSSAKNPACLFSHFLTNSTSLQGSLCCWYSGFCERHGWGTSHLRKHLWRNLELPWLRHGL